MILLGVGGGLFWLTQNKLLTTKTPAGTNCGGISGIICPQGYTCSYPESATYPDAIGKCVPKK
ncbi:MAG: hypothetical protein WCV88_03940 [Patescibacteria group bacterium]